METADVIKVFVQTPCEALRPFVKRFLVVEFPSGQKDSHLPDTGVVVAFRYKGDLALDGGIKAPQATITGLWDTRRAHGLSQSALERRFRRIVGASPKKFASIVRLRQVLYLRAKGADFTSIAHAAGYYDQSHFITAKQRRPEARSAYIRPGELQDRPGRKGCPSRGDRRRTVDRDHLSGSS